MKNSKSEGQLLSPDFNLDELIAGHGSFRDLNMQNCLKESRHEP
jgi:hypothetical protein